MISNGRITKCTVKKNLAYNNLRSGADGDVLCSDNFVFPSVVNCGNPHLNVSDIRERLP